MTAAAARAASRPLRSLGIGVGTIAFASLVALEPTLAAPPPRPSAQTLDPHRITVSALSNLCRSQDASAQVMCRTYLVAVADTLTVFGKSGSPDGLCLPNYSSNDLPPLFLRWVNRRRGLDNAPALLGAIMSLREQWSCR